MVNPKTTLAPPSVAGGNGPRPAPIDREARRRESEEMYARARDAARAMAPELIVYLLRRARKCQDPGQAAGQYAVLGQILEWRLLP